MKCIFNLLKLLESALQVVPRIAEMHMSATCVLMVALGLYYYITSISHWVCCVSVSFSTTLFCLCFTIRRLCYIDLHLIMNI